MTPRLVLHSSASADLDDLWESEEEAAADIEVLLEEIQGDPELLAALARHQTRMDRFHVSRLLRYDLWGRSLWRLKVWELNDPQNVLQFRLIYAWLGNVIYVLAIMNRDQNYESDRGFVRRIKEACSEIGIPTHL